MQTELAIAIGAGLGGMIGWGLADFFAKKTIDTLGDTVTLFWAQLIGIIPLLILFAFNPQLPHGGGANMLAVVSFGIVSGASYLVLYHGFGKGEISILSPIFASYSGFLVLISAFLFHESISPELWLLVGILFVGIMITSIDPAGLKSSFSNRATKGVGWVLAAMVVYTVWLALWDRFLIDQPWVVMLLLVRLVAAATVWAWARGRKISLKIPNRRMWLFVALIGVCDVGAYAALTYGFSATSYVSIVAVLSGAFSVPTIILARVFLKERMSVLQGVGVAVILAGIIEITLAV